MFFFSQTNIRFVKQNLVWRDYMVVETLLTTKKVKLNNNYKVANRNLEKIFKTCVVYVVTLKIRAMTIYPF